MKVQDGKIIEASALDLSVQGLRAALNLVEQLESEIAKGKCQFKTAVAYPRGLDIQVVEIDRDEYIKLAKAAIQSTLDALREADHACPS